MHVFAPLVRLKDSEEMIWGPEQHETFDQIKASLAHPLVLVQPLPRRHLKLYITAEDEAIDYLLAQDADDGTKKLSITLVEF